MTSHEAGSSLESSLSDDGESEGEATHLPSGSGSSLSNEEGDEDEGEGEFSTIHERQLQQLKVQMRQAAAEFKVIIPSLLRASIMGTKVEFVS